MAASVRSSCNILAAACGFGNPCTLVRSGGWAIGRRLLSSGADASALPPTFVEGFHEPTEVARMKYRKLGRRCVDLKGNPMEVSILSLGASSFGGVYQGETNEDECIQVTHEALKAGINLIDTAAWYGHGRAESTLAKALKGIPRDAFYLNTKVCRYEPDVLQMFDWSYDRTLKAIDEALERMEVDYIDTIQVHDPEFAPTLDLVVNNVFKAFVKAKEEGKVRMLGVTGYPLETLRSQIVIAEAEGIEINTCLSYSHYTLHDTSLVSELIPFLKEKGVGLINASPISMGLLSNRGPPVWHPAPELLRSLASEAAEYCAKNEVDIGKLCMQFSLQDPSIPTTLVSTKTLTRFKDNLKQVHELGKLTKKEQEVLNYLRNEVFGPHGDLDWVGIEVEKYWRKLDKESLFIPFLEPEKTTESSAMVSARFQGGYPGIALSELRRAKSWSVRYKFSASAFQARLVVAWLCVC